MEERVQKILARAGYGSRRSCEDLISAGRVQVNGHTISLGDKADAAADRITMDGKPVKGAEELVYVAVYKPRGVLSTVSEPGEKRVVRDLIPLEGTLYPVGRLDYDSEGLILMTNDGELANQLTHPRYEHEKEYRVLVAKQPDPAQLNLWRRGVVLEDGFRTSPADVYVESKQGKGAWLNVTLKEGHKRQIREMGTVTGLPVVSIIRVRIGNLRLGNLKAGMWRQLSPEEVEALHRPTEKVERPGRGGKRDFHRKPTGAPKGRKQKTGA
jgi:23S rRNA pseudouridine2605 synthase